VRTAGTKLGPFWGAAAHKDASDIHHFQLWDPPTEKLMDWEWSSLPLVEELYARLPTTIFTLRQHPLSEEKEAMANDPIGTAIRHADFWAGVWARLKTVKGFDPNRTHALGINEPAVGTAHQCRILTDYTVRFLDEMAARGCGAGALNLSVGWPDNSGPDTAVNWAPFAPVREAILRYPQHVLVLHEYWAHGGPNAWKGWHVDRVGQCPWRDVKIVIGECGWDHGVVDGNLIGFRQYISEEEYMRQLEQYDREVLRRDKRIIGGQVYCWDYGNNIWWHFDIRGMGPRIAEYAGRIRNEPYQHDLPIPRYPANVTNPTPAPTPTPVPEEPKMIWTEKLDAALREEFGSQYANVISSMPVNPNVSRGAFNVPGATGIAVHHTASTGTFLQAAQYHAFGNDPARGKTPWYSIAYTVGVGWNGRVFLLKPVEWVGNHVWGMNERLLSVVVAGDLTARKPTDQEVDAVARVCKVYEKVLGRSLVVKGHNDWALAGHGTSCPGPVLTAWARNRTPITPPPPPPPPDNQQLVRDARWNAEETKRQLDRGEIEPAKARLLEVIGWLYQLEAGLEA
jgi:hypothetical protein